MKESCPEGKKINKKKRDNAIKKEIQKSMNNYETRKKNNTNS